MSRYSASSSAALESKHQFGWPFSITCQILHGGSVCAGSLMSSKLHLQTFNLLLFNNSRHDPLAVQLWTRFATLKRHYDTSPTLLLAEMEMVNKYVFDIIASTKANWQDLLPSRSTTTSQSIGQKWKLGCGNSWTQGVLMILKWPFIRWTRVRPTPHSHTPGKLCPTFPQL